MGPGQEPDRPRLKVVGVTDHGWDDVKRMDAVLKAHKGWSVRYDGQRDKIVAEREDGAVVAKTYLREVLDGIEALYGEDGGQP